VLSDTTVTAAAGHNINTQAAQIVATDDVVMAAGNNLNIGTATSTHSEQHDTTTQTSGVFTSGLNLMIGSSKESQSYTETDTTPQGSVIGSLNGGVTLTAGNLAHITGSDVISNTGTAIVGKDVTIDAAVGTQDTTQTYKQQQAGLTLGLGGKVADAVNSAYYSAEHGSQVSDDRLKALYAMQAYYSASDALGMAGTSLGQAATKSGNPEGINLQLGIGASSASSTTTTHDETAYGSHIRSNGDVTIAATGGNLNIIGSQIDGNNVALAAANNLNILSQQENHRLQSSNKNASGGVGIQIGSDDVGFYAQGSVGKGSAHGNGTTHAESLISANDTLTVVAGNDATIKGAQLTGNTVIGAIVGNLLIQSEQHTDDYASKQQQLGGKMVIGYGSGGSISYNQSKVNSHYQSVNEVSGIQAGSGGFDIIVGGNTHLIGGVIASTADPSKNLLDTGSLTYESIHNEANYSASSTGISASYSAGGGGYGGSGFSGAPTLGVPQSGHSSSDTNSGIAQGMIIQRDGDTDPAGLDRNPTLDNQALHPIFDAQKVQEQMEMSDIAGQVGMRAAGDIAGQMGWTEGSTERTVLHGVVGAGIAALGGGDVVGGASGAAANQLVVQKMVDYLVSQGYTPGSSEFASMLQLASTAVGAAVGGGAGAATALDGTTYNYLTHQQLTDLQKEINRCEGDRVCIESAKSTAEMLSADQEKLLVGGCSGSFGSLSDTCKANILAARAYATDPLAAQLGLQVDQNISLQNYLNHQSQWGLVYADEVRSQNGQLFFAPAVAGAGTAVAVAAAPATLAWGQEAWAAYQVATQGYSLTAAMGSGAVFSGVTYTGLAATGAVADRYIHGTDLGTAFNNRWSPMRLIGTMGIGAVGGAYQTAMFQAANVANTWKNFYTIEGAVIRGNQMLMTIPAKKAVQAAAQQTTPSQPPAQGRQK
jgi:filamentous hemagglutinin